MINKNLFNTSGLRNEATYANMKCYTTTTYVVEMPLTSAVSEVEYDEYEEEFGKFVKLDGIQVMIEATVQPNIHEENGKYVIFYYYGMADLAHRYNCRISYVDSLEMAEKLIEKEMSEILYSKELNWYSLLAEIEDRLLKICTGGDEWDDDF